MVPSLYGMAVLLHAKVTTLQLISKNGHNLGSDYHFLMKLSGFLNYGQEKMPKKFQVDSSLFEAFEIFAFFRQISKNGPISPIQNSIDLIY